LFRYVLANDGFQELQRFYVASARFCGILILDNHSRMQFLDSAHRRRVSRRKKRSNWGLRPSSLFFAPLLSEPQVRPNARPRPGAEVRDPFRSAPCAGGNSSCRHSSIPFFPHISRLLPRIIRTHASKRTQGASAVVGVAQSSDQERTLRINLLSGQVLRRP
jgi:hypothetical protein